MYQDVNQQQVLSVATLGVQQVLHTHVCRIRCETTAVPIQPVINLHQKTKNTQKVINLTVRYSVVLYLSTPLHIPYVRDMTPAACQGTWIFL